MRKTGICRSRAAKAWSFCMLRTMNVQRVISGYWLVPFQVTASTFENSRIYLPRTIATSFDANLPLYSLKPTNKCDASELENQTSCCRDISSPLCRWRLRKTQLLLYNHERKPLHLPNDGEGKPTQTPGFAMPTGHSTPITPFDQIMHTPLQPPELPRPGTRKTPNSGTSDCLPLVKPICYISTVLTSELPSTPVLIPLQNTARRSSVVAPPNATPMRAPRRLSYTRTFGVGRTTLPLTSVRIATSPSDNPRTCTENSILLASPVAIRSSNSFTPIENRWPQDHLFSSLGSPPRVMNVA